MWLWPSFTHSELKYSSVNMGDAQRGCLDQPATSDEKKKKGGATTETLSCQCMSPLWLHLTWQLPGSTARMSFSRLSSATNNSPLSTLARKVKGGNDKNRTKQKRRSKNGKQAGNCSSMLLIFGQCEQGTSRSFMRTYPAQTFPKSTRNQQQMSLKAFKQTHIRH